MLAAGVLMAVAEYLLQHPNLGVSSKEMSVACFFIGNEICFLYSDTPHLFEDRFVVGLPSVWEVVSRDSGRLLC